MLFWVMPGINADVMQVDKAGRVCKAPTGAAQALDHFPPKGDDQNPIDFMVNLQDFMGVGVPYNSQPPVVV